MVRSNPTRILKPPRGILSIGEGKCDLCGVLLFLHEEFFVCVYEKIMICYMSSGTVLNFPPSNNWVSVLRPHMQIRSALCFCRTGNLNSAGNLNITEVGYFLGQGKSVLPEI